MNKTKKNHRYVPLEEGAAYLAVSTRTLRRMISSGEIKGYRIGSRTIRIDLYELEEIVQPIQSADLDGAA